MNTTIFFTICSFFYSLLLIINLFSKKRDNKDVIKIYKYMAVSNFFGIIIEIILWTCIVTIGTEPIITTIFARAFLVYLVIWISLLTIYMCTIAYADNEKDKKKIQMILYSLLLVLIVLVIVLPMYYSKELIYTYGPSTKIIYYVSEVYVFISFMAMIINRSKVQIKHYAPLFAYVTGAIIIMLIQYTHPEYLLMTAMETFITFITYFNLEQGNSRKVSNDEKKLVGDKND